MRALALFIATESQGIRKPRLNSIPTRKGIRIQKGKPKRVCRSTGRSTDPCPRSTRPKPRAVCFQSVDRAVDRYFPRSTGRSIRLTLCMSCIPVDRAIDRPSPPVDCAVDRELIPACPMHCLAPLSSDLCATFFHLLCLLSPFINFVPIFHFSFFPPVVCPSYSLWGRGDCLVVGVYSGKNKCYNFLFSNYL